MADFNNENILTVPVLDAAPAAEALEALGLIVTFKAGGEAQQQSVEDVFKSVGFGHDAPKPRTLRDSLHSGLVETFSKKNRPVRPTKRGYEVVQEHATEDGIGNTREDVVKAWIERDRNSGGEVVRVDVPEQYETVKAATDAAAKRVDGTAIGKALSAVAVGRLGGFSIRDGGGAYWIPPQSVETWLKLSSGLSATGAVRFRKLTIVGDNDTVDSLVDGATDKVDGILKSITAELDKGTLGPRGLVTQSEAANALVEEVLKWEETLGRALDAIRSRAEEVQVRAAQAALAALAAGEAEAA